MNKNTPKINSDTDLNTDYQFTINVDTNNAGTAINLKDAPRQTQLSFISEHIANKFEVFFQMDSTDQLSRVICSVMINDHLVLQVTDPSRDDTVPFNDDIGFDQAREIVDCINAAIEQLWEKTEFIIPISSVEYQGQDERFSGTDRPTKTYAVDDNKKGT